MTIDQSDIAMKRRRRRTPHWWRFAAIRRYYTLRGGRPIDGTHGMGPKFGRGKYVSVFRRGPFLEMEDHRIGDVIRLVPYQPNHGVMVERWVNGRVLWRTHLDVDRLRSMGFGERESA